MQRTMDIPHGSLMVTLMIGATGLLVFVFMWLITQVIERTQRWDWPDGAVWIAAGITFLAGINIGIISLLYLWAFFWSVWGSY